MLEFRCAIPQDTAYAPDMRSSVCVQLQSQQATAQICQQKKTTSAKLFQMNNNVFSETPY
jgi:hypothetical protein